MPDFLCVCVANKRTLITHDSYSQVTTSDLHAPTQNLDVVEGII